MCLVCALVYLRNKFIIKEKHKHRGGKRKINILLASKFDLKKWTYWEIIAESITTCKYLRGYENDV